MDEMNEVVSQMTIVVPADEVEELRQELLRNNMTPLQAETEGFDGASIVELIVPLTTIAIPALVSIYKARVAANRYISYRSDDFEVKGVSDATLSKLVQHHRQRKEGQ
jgi:hypothetical protein